MIDGQVTDPVLVCPHCRRNRSLTGGSGREGKTEMTCLACGCKVPTVAGVADFAPHIPAEQKAAAGSLVQRLNHSRFFSFYYDKAVWRPLLTRIGSWLSLDEETRIILDYAKVGPTMRIADLACGTGRYTRELARHCPGGRVYGVDLSPAMLRQAAETSEGTNLANVTLLRGDLFRLPFADACLQRVNCCGVLHLFADARPIWGEIARVLAPGGIFTAWVLTYAPNAFRHVQERLDPLVPLYLFEAQSLKNDLARVGLTSFVHEQHHLWLLFRAVRDG